MTSTRAQDNLNVAVGFGTLEKHHVGLRYEINQIKIGGNYGFNLAFSRINIGGDIFFHLTGYTPHSEMYPIYVRSGISYFQDEAYNYLFMPIRGGVDFYFNPRMGIALEAGLDFILDYNQYALEPIDTYISFSPVDSKFRPSLNGTFFFKFL